MADIASLSGIYQITNTVNGKRYIGSAVDFCRRWRGHRSRLGQGRHHSAHLQAAWGKYGETAFEFVVLEYCGRDQLVAREQAALDAFKPAYNVCLVAGSSLGHKATPQTREKMAARKHSAEQRAKMSAAMKGRTLTPEHIAKIKAGKKNISAETRANISAAQKGRIISAATRAKMSAAKSGRTLSSETKAKISVALTGVKKPWLTEEHMGKLRAGFRAYQTLRLTEATRG